MVVSCLQKCKDQNLRSSHPTATTCPQSKKSEVPKNELFIEFERAPDWIEGIYVFRMIFLQKLATVMFSIHERERQTLIIVG